MTLVLKRRCGESIVIGDDKIVVTVVQCFPSKIPGRGTVRLSVEAPHWVQVYRSELLEGDKSS